MAPPRLVLAVPMKVNAPSRSLVCLTSRFPQAEPGPKPPYLHVPSGPHNVGHPALEASRVGRYPLNRFRELMGKGRGEHPQGRDA